MVSKKQKERKKKIQERQKSGRKQEQIQSLLDNRQKILLESNEYRKEAQSLRQSDEAQRKQILDLERKLRSRDQDVVNMHDNHVKMRRSLTEIRELHLPIEPTYDPSDDVPCQECGKRWPCPTYRKIRTPDHVVVSSLIEMERSLLREEQ